MEGRYFLEILDGGYKNKGLNRISLWDHFNHKSPRHSNIGNKIQLHCITRGCIVYAFFFPLFFPTTNVPATFLLPWLNTRTKRDLRKEFILNYSSREIRVHLIRRHGGSRQSDSLQQSCTLSLPPQVVPPTGEKVCTCLSLWGTFLL